MPYSPKTWVDDDPITPTDLNRIETGLDEVTALAEADSGWQTSGITAASGWSISAQKYRKVGNLCVFYIDITRTGSAITVPDTTGNITNSLVCTLPEGYRPDTYSQGLGSGGTGRMCTFVADPDGSLYMVAVSGPDNLATSSTYSIAGTLLV